VKRRAIAIVAGSAAAVLVLAAGVVVYLAHQRGAEIAQERATRSAVSVVVEIQTMFKSLSMTVQMKDGSRRAVVGEGSMLMWVRPQPGSTNAWVAVARSPEGFFFGQRFMRRTPGSLGVSGDAQELSAQLVMGGLRDQLREAGVDQAQAQVLFDAVTKGTPVPVSAGAAAAPRK